ncbi:competence protein ComGB [Salibacterium salarium]|uniref:competence type IV pilus assembly protein ComGB n=1 Tax=Salibacterium salarium TaxID=284579 RepID=UPI00278290A7|nr:competence type IV pilus assembly protein ComGB [Salibacterium salarium]MDQ0299692.1 competence protein ComGB [Salibacterium salarium]
MSKKWRKEEKADFLLKAGELLDQGYPLHLALQLLSWEQSYFVKEKILHMIEVLRTGSSFHEVLDRYDFPPDISAYVFFAEQTGSLPEGLKGSGGLFKKRLQTLTTVRRMLRYPLLLLWVLVMIAILMIHFLFPSFQQLFQSLDIEFPFLTKLMIQMFQYSPYILVVLLLPLAAGFVYYMMTFRHYTPQKQCRLISRIPFAATYLQLFLTYYFSLQFSSMLKGGISIYDACRVFEKQQHFPFFQAEGHDLKRMLKDGKPLYDAIEISGWYRHDMKYVIKHGQAAGKLEDDLYFYSDRVMKMLEMKVKKTVMTLQPIMFLFIGSIILAMFLSVFLPMFQLMTSIQ